MKAQKGRRGASDEVLGMGSELRRPDCGRRAIAHTDGAWGLRSMTVARRSDPGGRSEQTHFPRRVG